MTEEATNLSTTETGRLPSAPSPLVNGAASSTASPPSGRVSTIARRG
jgi:hypothetical protein